MRKYEPIWSQIRNSKEHKVSLAAPTADHKRIIKAVRKEKNKDIGFKFECSEQHLKYVLKEKIKGKLITFYLIDVSPIVVSKF